MSWWYLRSSSGASPTTNDRVMSAKHADSRSIGHRSITIGSSGWIGPDPMSWPEAVCGAVRDDQRVRAGAAPCDRRADRVLDELGGDRFAVGDQPGSAGLGPAQQLGRGAHARLGRGLRPPDPGELGVALDAAAGLEQLALHLQFHTVRAQTVGQLEREVAGHRGELQPERAGGADQHLEHRVLAHHAGAHQVVVAELLVACGP